MRAPKKIFLTGVTGLVGGGVLQRMLWADPDLHAYVLIRREDRWRAAAERLRLPAGRVTPIFGDLRAPGLGLSAELRASLAREVEGVLHSAADTTFSRPYPDVHAVNVEGTRHMLETSAEWPLVRRFAFISTAFVAGRRVGLIADDDPAEEATAAAGWVNYYERCKYEAEQLVRAGASDWVIFRPSSIICDAATGSVHQYNVIHWTLRLCHHGLASMLPGTEDTPMDSVPSDYVNDAIARLAFDPRLAGRILHLCAGAGALPLGELLDVTYRIWERSPEWSRRGVCRPALTDIDTYRLFERSVHEAGERRMVEIMRSFSFFVPQLTFPKRFDTSGADAALGTPAPEMRSYWPRMIEHLLESDWAAAVREGA